MSYHSIYHTCIILCSLKNLYFSSKRQKYDPILSHQQNYLVLDVLLSDVDWISIWIVLCRGRSICFISAIIIHHKFRKALHFGLRSFETEMLLIFYITFWALLNSTYARMMILIRCSYLYWPILYCV